MKKYRVPVRYTYTEYVEVEAESEREAWEKVPNLPGLVGIQTISADELEWDELWYESYTEDIGEIDYLVDEVV